MFTPAGREILFGKAKPNVYPRARTTRTFQTVAASRKFFKGFIKKLEYINIIKFFKKCKIIV